MSKSFYNKFGTELRTKIKNGLRGNNLRSYLNGAGINTGDINSPIHFSESNPNKLVIEVRGSCTYHIV